MTSPNAAQGGSDANILWAVAAARPDEVWAVGYYASSSGINQTLIEEWNGTSWHIVASPNIGNASNSLQSVTAISPKNVWAVGEYFEDVAQRALVEHWNGSTWNIVATPDVGGASSDYFTGVTAISSTDVWAVGELTLRDGDGHTLIEHWDGSGWKVVSSPSTSDPNSALTGVSGASARDIWAVGATSGYGPNTDILIEHWNGSKWTIISTPSPSTGMLAGVAAISADSALAAGLNVQTGGDAVPILEQWNGTAW